MQRPEGGGEGEPPSREAGLHRTAGSAASSFVLAFSPLSAQPNDVGTVRAGMEHTEERSRELPCSWGAPEATRKVTCV